LSLYEDHFANDIDAVQDAAEGLFRKAQLEAKNKLDAVGKEA
jgi:hypothetical protein